MKNIFQKKCKCCNLPKVKCQNRQALRCKNCGEFPHSFHDSDLESGFRSGYKCSCLEIRGVSGPMVKDKWDKVNS